MAVHEYVNTASVARLDQAISSAALSVTLSNYSGFPTAFPFYAEIGKGTALAEIVEVTAAAGSVLTIVRGQDGTVASAHSVGDEFEHVAPAYVFNLAEDHAAALAAHGTTTAIVGVADTGTLTNKTYRGAHNHTFSDANPSGLSAGYKSIANSAIGRDGFVHDNTAGDVNRKAFLSQQVGIDRFAVFNDGTVKISPDAAAARPGLQLDDDLDVNGPANISGQLDVGGAVVVQGAAHSVGALSTDAGLAGNALTVAGVAVKPQTNPDVQVFTVAGAATWTKPAGARWVFVEVIGAGGGSGGTDASTSTTAGESGCGGGGGGARKLFAASALGTTEQVTVGAGGAAAAAGINSGGTGGASSFSAVATLVTANGGDGGNGSGVSSGGTIASGGGGGTASGGDVNLRGGFGANGRSHDGSALRCSYGGAAPFIGVSVRTTSASPASGLDGIANTGGGASATTTQGTAIARGGGMGATGLVTVITYFSG